MSAPAIPPSPPVATTVTVVATGAVTVVDLPAALRAIASATLLEAIVVGRDAAGLTTLRSDSGTVTVRGAPQLPPGSSVTVQLPAAGGDAATLVPQPPRPQAVAPAPASLDPPPRVASGVAVTATVISTASAPPPAADHLPRAPVADAAAPALRGAYQAVVAEGATVGAKPTPATATVPTETAGATRPAAGADAQLPDPHAAPTPAARASDMRADFARLQHLGARAAPAAGATVELRLAPTPTAAPAAGEQRVPATIVGRTPAGQTVLDTPLGRLAAALPPSLAAAKPGTPLLFLWQPTTPEPPPTALSVPRDFAALRQALAFAGEAREPVAREALDRALPRPGPRLAQQLMGFVEAAESGVRRWLGDAAHHALERLGGGDLLRQLDAQLRESARNAPAAEWRHFVMPFADGGALRPIDVWTRRQRGRERDRPRDQSRFVVECVHDEWGDIQIDGLMTAVPDGRRLDVVLRSRAALPDALRGDLRGLFAEACGAMGVAGDLAFQAVAVFPVRPGEGAARARAVVA